MFEKCDLLTEKIKRYERLRLSGLDKLTMERIEKLMVDLRAQHAALLAEEKGFSRSTPFKVT